MLERTAWTQACDLPEGRIETRFQDGAVCVGLPQDNEQYLATARELGYGEDVKSLCIDNDSMHAFVCERAGLPICPVLYGTAHGERWWPWWEAEDNVVLAIQALLNGVEHGALQWYRQQALTSYLKWVRPRSNQANLLLEAKAWLAAMRGSAS